MLNEEQTKQVVNLLTNLYTRTQSDIANLNDRMASLAQLVNELNNILQPKEDESDSEVVVDENPTPKKKTNEKKAKAKVAATD